MLTAGRPAFRTRSGACDTLSRPCVRHVRQRIVFSLAPALRSTTSAAGHPAFVRRLRGSASNLIALFDARASDPIAHQSFAMVGQKLSSLRPGDFWEQVESSFNRLFAFLATPIVNTIIGQRDRVRPTFHVRSTRQACRRHRATAECPPDRG